MMGAKKFFQKRRVLKNEKLLETFRNIKNAKGAFCIGKKGGEEDT